MDKREVHYQPGLRLFHYAGAGLFGLLALMGALSLTADSTETLIAGLLSLIGFGWAASVFVRREMGPPAVTMDDDGLTFLMHGKPVTIKWDELERAELDNAGHGHTLINLWAREPDQFRKRLPLLWRLCRTVRHGIAPRSKSRDAWLYFPHLSVEPETLVAAIREKAPSAWNAKAEERVRAQGKEREATAPTGRPGETRQGQLETTKNPPEPVEDETALHKLENLHERGILTDDEYAAKKRQLTGE